MGGYCISRSFLGPTFAQLSVKSFFPSLLLHGIITLQMKIPIAGLLVLAALCQSARPNEASFFASIKELKQLCPVHFLPDVVIEVTHDVTRPTTFGEPNPPEGFAGPDPAGRHPTGIYLPSADKEWAPGDISNEQWVFHEMFHLHNRRLHDYDPFIAKAFPDETDPLVQWMKRSKYHRTFAKEEAFINLITFADPARTKAQKEAVREWYDYVGATNRSLDDIRKAMKVVEHPS